MSRRVLLDTGPLVAFLDRRDQFHQWSTNTLNGIQYPVFTCEPVITEACFLLSRTYAAQEAVMTLISDGLLEIDFEFQANADAIKTLMTKYGSIPMSLADACLVRMAELRQNSAAMTLDSDFRVYRMKRNEQIPLIMPKS